MCNIQHMCKSSTVKSPSKLRVRELNLTVTYVCAKEFSQEGMDFELFGHGIGDKGERE